MLSFRELGKQAYLSGLPQSASPFPRLTPAWWQWLEGYLWAATHYPTSRRGAYGGLSGAGGAGVI